MSRKLIVFDWDGTLMDSEAKIVTCMQGAISNLAMDSRSDDEIRHIIGLGLREALVQLFPSATEDDYVALTDRYRHHFLHSNDTPSPLFAGAETLIQRLHAEGHFLAVATGKGRQGLDKVLSETELAPYFHYTRCADEAFSKPHPKMLEDILDWLGADKNETVMIGDTEYDLQMAHNAGVSSLAISHGVHDVSRLMACTPLACLDNLEEVSVWLDTHFIQAA